MLEKGKAENELDIQLYDVSKKFDFDEQEFPSEIRLIPISSGATLDQLGKIVYETNNGGKSSNSGYNLLNMKCYNNVNRARYAFLN